MKKPVLVSWIGHADLAAMCLDLEEADRQVVHAAVQNLPTKTADKPGPLKTAIQARSFAEVHLLTNYPGPVNSLYARWLGVRPTVHEVQLASPTDYTSIFHACDGAFRQLWPRWLREKKNAWLLLSPGTPAMAAVLILLGKSRYPGEFCQTFKGQLQQTEIPFDLVDDFIPDLLRNPDLNLQHLAAQSPGQLKGFEAIVGDSQAIRLAVGRAQRAALRDVPVLLLGESGTGKEMFARAIHQASHRREKPFIPVNCAAIPRELLESELFGHVKGAYTGAEKARDGAFKRADGGTLFLDEIGDCDPAMQAKLLRALQPPSDKGPCHREFSPVGGEKILQADVRVLAATNRDLVEDIQANRFRDDLYYRLAVISLHLPPLRERSKDLSLLAESLLKRINQQFKTQGQAEPGYQDKSLSADAIAFVKSYPWPGNVRQLQNALTQAAVMAEGDTIQRADLLAAVGNLDGGHKVDAMGLPLGGDFDLEEHLKSIQSHYLRRAMRESHGVKAEAARLLGYKNYQTLAAQLTRLGVEWEEEINE